MKSVLNRIGPLLAVLSVVVLASAFVVVAQPRYETVRGMLTDSTGRPLQGYRVVFQQAGGGATVLGDLTGVDGEYTVSLPVGSSFVPLEVVTPAGTRVPLAPRAACAATPAERCNVVLASASPTAAATPSAAAPAAGAGAPIELTGRVLDPLGQPIVGYRVAFRAAAELKVYLSEPTQADGTYTVAIPERELVVPVALIAPDGRRHALDEDELPIQAMASVRRDITATVVAPSRSLPEPAFPGADRLFLALAEDTAIVPHYRGELRFVAADSNDADLFVTELNGAIRLPQLPQVELGARVGVGESDTIVGNESGLDNVEIWGKVTPGTLRRGGELGVGFVISLPTGQEAPGLGADALSTKIFAAGRRAFPWGVLTFHGGVRFTENGTIFGHAVDGKVGGVLSAGVILPFNDEFVFIGEGFVESERFEGQDTDTRLLAGFNWRAMRWLTARVAVSAGLTDGAPDSQMFAGLAFDY